MLEKPEFGNIGDDDQGIRRWQANLLTELDEMAAITQMDPAMLVQEMMTVVAARGGDEAVIRMANTAAALLDELPDPPKHPVTWAAKRAQTIRTRRR